jgi:hypothetical protein
LAAQLLTTSECVIVTSGWRVAPSISPLRSPDSVEISLQKGKLVKKGKMNENEQWWEREPMKKSNHQTKQRKSADRFDQFEGGKRLNGGKATEMKEKAKHKPEALLGFLKSLQCAMEIRPIQETGRTKPIPR